LAHPFYFVDVFAERPYAGNQLAAIVCGDDFSDETMQRIAVETNFSETTFVSSTPGEDDGYGVRV
jgi:trans-2,3-dihydro-3-hydroxyanthranilate isomerase